MKGTILHCLIAISMVIYTNAALTQEVKDQIVQFHNDFRKAVDPAATDMTKMYWNEDLARSAQGFADKCQSGHDGNLERRKSADIGCVVGQNAASGQETWEKTVTDWHAEVENYTYGAGSKNGEDIGHYTQVVKGKSALVGCGENTCSNLSPYGNTRICNYAWGNLDMNRPYTQGDSCAACPNKCPDGKLCDCDGKICKNGGVMNWADCTCTCRTGASGFTWGGDDCSVCPAMDLTTACGKDYVPDECYYGNVPEECPIMCGFCQAKCPGTDLNTCKNGGKMDISICKCVCPGSWEGDTCDKFKASACSDLNYCDSYDAYDNPCQYAIVKTECPKKCSIC